MVEQNAQHVGCRGRFRLRSATPMQGHLKSLGIQRLQVQTEKRLEVFARQCTQATPLVRIGEKPADLGRGGVNVALGNGAVAGSGAGGVEVVHPVADRRQGGHLRLHKGMHESLVGRSDEIDVRLA